MKVLNARFVGKSAPNAVYCGRPSIYGNPFYMPSERHRDTVCDKYEEWIFQPAQDKLRAHMKTALKGKDLICWCSPKRCHCDTIKRIVESD